MQFITQFYWAAISLDENQRKNGFKLEKCMKKKINVLKRIFRHSWDLIYAYVDAISWKEDKKRELISNL